MALWLSVFIGKLVVWAVFFLQFTMAWNCGSAVVECLTRDRTAAGLSLTRRHCDVVFEKDTFILA